VPAGAGRAPAVSFPQREIRMSSNDIDVTGRLSIYLRGGGVIALSHGQAQLKVDGEGKAKEIKITDGHVELVWIDTAEVVAIIKEGDARESRFGL
jgi:hypothetical protein